MSKKCLACAGEQVRCGYLISDSRVFLLESWFDMVSPAVFNTHICGFLRHINSFVVQNIWKAYRDNGMIAWDSLQFWENQLPSVHQGLSIWTQRPVLTAPSLCFCFRVNINIQIISDLLYWLAIKNKGEMQDWIFQKHINPWHISQRWKKTWSLVFYVCLLFIFPDWNVLS